MPQPSQTVVEALDRIAGQIRPLPELAIEPFEEVLLLTAEGHRCLHGDPPPLPKDALWYYHFRGEFSGLFGGIKGHGKVESVLSWFFHEVGPIVFDFPDSSLGEPPFDRPPANGYKGVKTNAETLGHTKTRIEFPDGSELVSFGVNQTKLALLKNHDAALWETNTEVIVSGTGRFEGAKGLVTSDMGGYFHPLVPLDPTTEPYKSGFRAKVLISIRLVSGKKLPG